MDNFLFLCRLIGYLDVCEGNNGAFSNLLEILKVDFLLIIRDHFNHFSDFLFGIRLPNVFQKKDNVLFSDKLILININDLKGLNDFLFAKWSFANFIPSDILPQWDLFSLYFGLVLLVLAQVYFIVIFLDLSFAGDITLVYAFIYEIVRSFNLDLVFALVVFLLLFVKYTRKRCRRYVWCVRYVWYRKWNVQNIFWHFF